MSLRALFIQRYHNAGNELAAFTYNRNHANECMDCAKSRHRRRNQMSQFSHYKRNSCRACGGESLSMFLSLGDQPLANSFLSGPGQFAKEKVYPLEVYFCHDCSLVQLRDVVNPEILFRDYIYVTGTSETMLSHNEAYSATVTELLALGRDDLVVEAASNDGSLLKQFQ